MNRRNFLTSLLAAPLIKKEDVNYDGLKFSPSDLEKLKFHSSGIRTLSFWDIEELGRIEEEFSRKLKNSL